MQTMFRQNIVKWLFFILLSIYCSEACANTLTDFFSRTQIDGDLRMYDFNRIFNNPDTRNETSFALGGSLNALTAPFLSGFQIGATFYTSQPLGLNSNNRANQDNSLPGFPVNVLGQTFLQYKTTHILMRAGNQLINTPWLGPSDTRMIPATYQGILANYAVNQDLNFTALRIIRFKSRTAKGFDQTNLYNTGNFVGTGIPAYGNRITPGAAAVGSNYQHDVIHAQAWFYQFYSFSQLFYADASYTFKTSTIFKPSISIQGLRESEQGSNELRKFAFASPNSNVVGLLLGTDIGSNATLTVGYNDIPQNRHAFNNGDIASPYTSGYISDPLYTTSMIAGLVEKSAGQAVKASIVCYVLQRQLRLAASYAKYYTDPVLTDTNETDGDVTYFLKNRLKGLSLRDRIGVLNGNRRLGRDIYNRIMVQYNF